MTFTSRPGVLTSGDDFYVISSSLVCRVLHAVNFTAIVDLYFVLRGVCGLTDIQEIHISVSQYVHTAVMS